MTSPLNSPLAARRGQERWEKPGELVPNTSWYLQSFLEATEMEILELRSC